MRHKKELFREYEKSERFLDQSDVLTEELGMKKEIRKRLVIRAVLISSLVCFLLAAGGAYCIATGTRIDKIASVKKMNDNYSLLEKQRIQQSSFRSLNEIDYGNGERKETKVSTAFQEAVTSFSQSLYDADSLENRNAIISPVGLYANLDILSLGSDEMMKGDFNRVLGLSAEERGRNYRDMIDANFFKAEKGTSQLRQGMFFSGDHGFKVNPTYLDELTSRNVEAFSLSFYNDSDVSKMIEWVNFYTNGGLSISKDDLSLFPEGSPIINTFMLYTAFYFNHKWQSTFNQADNYEDPFYLLSGETVQATYLNHKTITDVYDYDDYVAFYDYYENGIKIKYYVPKEKSDSNAKSPSIFEILKGKHFLREDEKKKKVTYVDLSLPKFSYSYQKSFKEVLGNLGLSNAFDSNQNAFGPMFSKNPNDYSIYLGDLRQNNKVTFSEDGTEVISLTIAQGFGGADLGEDGVYKIVLNQPFIYGIYDQNDLPIFLGQVTNPR